MDIEDALRWAFRDELPKLAREGGDSSFLFNLSQLGCRVDDTYEPGLPMALGPCHPDALKISAAVDALARFAGMPIEDKLELGPDFGASPADETAAMEHAMLMVPGLVAGMARMPSRMSRPGQGPRPSMAAARHPNGKPIVARWEERRRRGWSAGDIAEDVAEEVMVPVLAIRANTYPDGAFCPLLFDPPLREVLDERAEYLAWWAGLNALAADLFDELESIALLPPSAPQKPWLGEAERGKPPRIFEDLTARTYRVDQATAAAHRALGMRRFRPARGSEAANVIARRPAVTPQRARGRA